MSKRIPDDLTTHLYMLGISLENYKNVLETIKEIDKTGKTLGKIKKELTQDGTKKIADVKAELNNLEAELCQLEEAMDAFKSNDAFASIEAEIVELENMLDQLRQKQRVLKREYILTLNRDKIENEEKRNQIKMDIDSHEIAVYTKEKKFLKRDYQEK